MNDQNKLLEEMLLGALVITPNNRLSKQLLDDYCIQYSQDQNAIPKPNCMPFTTFLQKRYQKIQHAYPEIKHPVLINNYQEICLWKEILAKKFDFQVNLALLKQIQNARKIYQNWQTKLSNKEFVQTKQTENFNHWQKEFYQNLNKINAITMEDLINYFSKYPLNDNKTIIWACFDDYTPAQIFLQNTLKKQGNAISHYELTVKTATTQKYTAKNKKDEYETMLLWAKSRLELGDKKIALIVPNLTEDGKLLTRLAKQKLLENQFNISLGQSLNEFPQIAHALQFICLNDTSINNQEARLLLSSPYITNSANEFLNRAEFMQKNKLLTQNTIMLTDFISACQKYSPHLSKALANLYPYPKNATLIEWTDHFKHRLNSLGYPGEYALSSASYQCLQKLQELLDEFLKLAIIKNIMTKEEAISTLTSLSQENIFQLQKDPTPINILGLLEASGSTYDSIWICNLTDKCLPEKTNFSPFIPIAMQKELSMPRSSNEHELNLAKQLLDRLQSSCRKLVLSYPKFIDDIPMLPSPLINYLSIDDHNLIVQYKNKLTLKNQLEEYRDNYQIPLLNKDLIKGGTSLIANQAQCPFKAFASHRLHVIKNEEIVEWPSNIERGKILHKALEKLWGNIKTQNELNKLKYNECYDLITQIIIQNIQVSHELNLDSVIRSGEINRLTKLLLAFIEWEKSRPDFRVSAIEDNFSINIGGINFSVRVDRIDTMGADNEQKLVVDYKSSMPQSKPWNEDRPLEPQLLIYALLDENISGIAYIELKNGNIKISGISEQAQEISGIKTIPKDKKWHEYKNLWRTQLTNIVDEFTSGLCTPTPTKAIVCTRCSFQNLCRTHDFSLQNEL